MQGCVRNIQLFAKEHVSENRDVECKAFCCSLALDAGMYRHLAASTCRSILHVVTTSAPGCRTPHHERAGRTWKRDGGCQSGLLAAGGVRAHDDHPLLVPICDAPAGYKRLVKLPTLLLSCLLTRSSLPAILSLCGPTETLN